MYAIIGGTGLGQIAGLEKMRREVVRTPYGDPSCALTFGRIDGVEIVFIARHGYGHTIAPHEINYRANIDALHRIGVSAIVAIATVGAIRTSFAPGSLVLPDQIVDYTFGRRATFHEGPENNVVHIDFTEPYDAVMRKRLAAAAARCKVELHDGGTYGCTQGPRLETAAEIRRMERDGCDLVGMTGMPEATLARERSLPYATLAVVANHAAGKASSAGGIALQTLLPVVEDAMTRVRTILAEFLRQAPAEPPAITQRPPARSRLKPTDPAARKRR